MSLLYTIITEIILYLLLFYARQTIEDLLGREQTIIISELDKRMSYPIGSYLAQEGDRINMIIYVGFLLGIILFIVYFFLLTRRFTNYLIEISNGITEIAEGNFKVRIPVRNDDEFAVIAMKVNEMAGDIDTLVETERQIEITKQDLITSVAHDLRTPLTSIIGYLELVEQNGIEEEQNKKYIQVAYNKSKRLLEMIEDLFSYTKFSSGEVKLQRVELNFVTFIEQMVDEFYPSFQENHLECHLDMDKDPLLVSIDGNLMARAVANLLSNAIKYGKDGKQIIIKVGSIDEFATLDVINYGIVIPEKDLKNVFEKFYRVDASRSLNTGGSGLGLTITKTIISMHGGTITVESDYHGTVFHVRLPIYYES